MQRWLLAGWRAFADFETDSLRSRSSIFSPDYLAKLHFTIDLYGRITDDRGLTELLLSRGVKHGSKTAQCDLWAETVSDNLPLCQLALEFEQNWTTRGVFAKSFVVHLF